MVLFSTHSLFEMVSSHFASNSFAGGYQTIHRFYSSFMYIIIVLFLHVFLHSLFLTSAVRIVSAASVVSNTATHSLNQTTIFIRIKCVLLIAISTDFSVFDLSTLTQCKSLINSIRYHKPLECVAPIC